jgi:hypothetical protein
VAIKLFPFCFFFCSFLWQMRTVLFLTLIAARLIAADVYSTPKPCDLYSGRWGRIMIIPYDREKDRFNLTIPMQIGTEEVDVVIWKLMQLMVHTYSQSFGGPPISSSSSFPPPPPPLSWTDRLDMCEKELSRCCGLDPT